MNDAFKHMKRIEIELQSKCNRKCSWCPNTKFPRDISEEMPEDMFIRLMKEIQEGNYEYKETKTSTNYISFNRFSEPMYNIELLKKRVNQSLKIAPNLQYLINTNGDYLSKEALEGLYLDKLNIMDYDNKGMEYWSNKLKDIGVVIINKNHIDGKIVGVHRNIGKVNVEIDWMKHAELEDRAGFLDDDIFYMEDNIKKKIKWRNGKKVRDTYCIEPQFYTSIDANGSVMLCCHYRSDNPDHEDMILGNLRDNTLEEILNGEKANKFKEIMSSGDTEKFPEGCKRCQKIRGIQVREDVNLQKDINLKEFEK